MINMQQKNSSIIIGSRVWINGVELPPVPTKRKNHCFTQIDGKVYIDGYEFKNGKWKKTLAALWHKYF